jgi:hypothetical protein
MIADIALSCHMLDRFVYVSTAYANVHLYSQSHDQDMRINEEVYELQGGRDALDELKEVRKHGTSKAYEANDFPWAYAYAKNLTERLLQRRFSDTKEILLIVRPSIIGPSQSLPFPGYVMPMSSPPTILAAALILYPFRTIKIATRMDKPDSDVTGDEVPVDVVADRLLCHLAMGTYGCVHAVSGVRARAKYEPSRQSLMKLRRIPWELRPHWVKADWKSPNQHPLLRLYAISGTSFAFSEDRTLAMYQELSEKEKLDLQLFKQIDTCDSISTTAKDLRYAMDRLARKSWLAWLILWLFYSGFGKPNNANRSLKL